MSCFVSLAATGAKQTEHVVQEPLERDIVSRQERDFLEVERPLINRVTPRSQQGYFFCDANTCYSPAICQTKPSDRSASNASLLGPF